MGYFPNRANFEAENCIVLKKRHYWRRVIASGYLPPYLNAWKLGG